MRKTLTKRERADEMKAWAESGRAAARALFPLPDADLESLFHAVEASLEATACDHTRRLTEGWLASRELAAAPVLAWLGRNGGYCDCEVVNNAADQWECARERPTASPVIRPRKAKLAPPPERWVDIALVLPIPGKPWRFQRAPAPPVLLELALGRALLRVVEGAEGDRHAWCRARGMAIVAAALQMTPEEATSYWERFGMTISEASGLSQGVLAGPVRRACAPSRTHFFLWWHLDLGPPCRVVELVTETNRSDGDWREAKRVLAAASLIR